MITLRYKDGRTEEQPCSGNMPYFEVSETYSGTWIGPSRYWIAFQHRVFARATDGHYDEIGVRLPSGALLESWVCADEDTTQ
jgi:hypothetical protein